MPRAGSSVKAIQTCEDDAARMITACDHVDRFRDVWRVMRERGKITEATYRDGRDSLDCVANALLIARRYVGMARREVAG